MFADEMICSSSDDKNPYVFYGYDNYKLIDNKYLLIATHGFFYGEYSLCYDTQRKYYIYDINTRNNQRMTVDELQKNFLKEHKVTIGTRFFQNNKEYLKYAEKYGIGKDCYNYME
ncbi:MAG: hypothetical protein KGV48_000620 [Alcaligenaceae bacterium]|nr:hypothetical protein [Alcaligenaceae bacterium]